MQAHDLKCGGKRCSARRRTFFVRRESGVARWLSPHATTLPVKSLAGGVRVLYTDSQEEGDYEHHTDGGGGFVGGLLRCC
jgi:hypothetical protein